jgi:PAS domain S-box-containing protein
LSNAHIVTIVGWLSCLVLTSVGGEAAESPATKRVLVLHQYGLNRVTRASFDDAFVEGLRSVESVHIDVYVEAIETDRFPANVQAQRDRDYLRQKYADRSIDIIVAIGSAAFAFARQDRKFFGNPPIVAFASAGQFDGLNDDVTGLQIAPTYGWTLDLAVALLPDTRSVFVVDGAPNNDGDREAAFRRQFEDRDRGLSLGYFRDLSVNDLSSRLASLPDHSVVLFLNQTMRDQSHDIDQFEGLSHVVRASRVPVFSTAEPYLGRGIVGGYLSQVQPIAKRLIEITTLIANGAHARDIPVEDSPYVNLLDWRQLERWHIPESRVPAGSLVLFRPSSFFELYRRYVLGSLLIFTAQLALIIALVGQRVRRRRAEEQTRRSEERYRSVVDTQSELICRCLPDGALTFVNDAYCRYWSRTRDELLGRAFIELIPTSEREMVLTRFGSLSSGVDSYEHQVLLPDGTIGWLHWVDYALLDQEGRVVEIQRVGRDITDRRRAEAALGQAQARTTAILRAIPDVMFVLDRDGTYVDYHVKDPAQLAAPPSEFLGRNIRNVMPPHLVEAFVKAVQQTFESGGPVVFEYELLLNGIRFFEARLVRASEYRVLSIVRDVTEAKVAAARNRDLAGRLIASQEEERHRIARELHDDVSQKMALLAIDLDRFSQAAPIQPEALVDLRDRTAEIATDIHNLSYELHPSKLESLGLISAVQSLCREVSRQGQVQVVFTHSIVPAAIDPAISLCVYRIGQEALHNVARHSRAAEARVRLTYGAGAIALRVADSGIGFEPATAGRASLGLVSMRERAEFLGGALTIHSAPGHGTRIRVQIPLVQAGATSMPATTKSA